MVVALADTDGVHADTNAVTVACTADLTRFRNEFKVVVGLT